MIRDGRMRALLISSPERVDTLPEVPTAREAGLPELTLDFWAGVFAPAGTPPEIVGKLNAAINAALRSAEMKASMDKLGLDAKIGSPADFAKFVAEEVPRWAEIVRSTGMKAE
jgi:tripartite-type tricarboxylate transporter receptor subunit TctC